MQNKYIGTSAFIISLAILISLSYWQTQRLQWKNNVIEQLDIEYQKDPIKNQFNFEDLLSLKNENLALRYGQVTGRFEYEKTIFLGPKPHDNKIGYHVITPLQIKDGFILVNRGWVEENKASELSSNNRTTTINGVFRKPDWNSFTPNNSPENDIWTKPDIEEIARVKKTDPIAPVMLYASTKTSTIIIPQNKQWYPRNKHLQYAIFWFAMALTLSTVFGMFFLKSKKN